jgi:hypothetical protein
MKHFLPILFFLFLSQQLANAATRTVQFYQVGTSSARFNGFATTQTSRCVIAIYNPSATTQTYTVTAPVSATGISFTCSGAVAAGAPCSPASAVTPPASQTGTLAQGESVVLTWTYPAFPADTTGDITHVCTGEIQSVDNSGNLGFVQAVGELTVWIEDGTAVQGSNTISGGAKLENIKMNIDEGKPF